jgi:hypothetical protein
MQEADLVLKNRGSHVTRPDTILAWYRKLVRRARIDALSQFLLWRTNSEYSRFHFDFGYDDESSGAPSADSIAYFFRRRR